MFSKKHLFIGLLLLLVPLLILKLFLGSNKLKNNIISKQTNYMVSYTKVNDSNIHNIARYDMAILDPFHIKAQQVQSLKNAKTITYSYQSIFEVELYNKEKIQRLKEEDYLYIDGVKQFNEYYQCYYGDIRSPHYQQVLIDSIRQNVIDKGFDGVFFDTLDDIEFFIEEPLRTELFMEHIEFFKLLKSEFPHLSIIQNRAFNLYLLGSGEYIDAIMYEDLQYQDFEDPNSSQFYNNLKEDLNKTAMETDSLILALSYQQADKNYEFAKTANWLYYFYPPCNDSLEKEDPIYSLKIRPRY